MMTKRSSPRVTIGSMQRAEEAAGYALVCGPDFNPSAQRLQRAVWWRGLAIVAVVVMAGAAAASLFVA
ncbi:MULTISPECIES: hypothetical protein [unclassified Beijerinckia]|uniref:hypothetical protein n=1 Tax=unclassified Beijerinckia TaxID=2638183 RepID=UPI00089D99FA|nr:MULTISPECIES: hypothetical protein [unclassified Beijerinckia]MDH7795760.1 hypothetical protein [Beijerinckia sp. GAS462]SEC15089.1 hypothetical protein SAMN05443249_2037 [Beijerinckia sp. 28-YEA-48]